MTQPPAPKPEAEPIRDLARAFLVEEYKINRSAIQESTRAISSNYVYAVAASAAVAAWLMKDGETIHGLSRYVAHALPFLFALALFVLSSGASRRMRSMDRHVMRIEDLYRPTEFRREGARTEKVYSRKFPWFGTMEIVAWLGLLVANAILFWYGFHSTQL
jgi:hypothetical protein